MAGYNLAYSFAHTLVGKGRSFSKDNQTISLRLRSTADTSGQRARNVCGSSAGTYPVRLAY